MLKEEILICTIIRNCEAHIDNWFNQIKNYTLLVPDKSFSLSVYENDSKDQTKEKLKNYDYSIFKNFNIKTENINTLFYKTDIEKNSDRETRVKNLAAARNRCIYNSNLEIINFSKILFIEPDFYFNFDTFNKIVNCEERIGFKPDIFSGISYYNNQFYDRWATRHNENEFWGIFEKSDQILEVWSTFNGICLYNADPIKNNISFGWFNDRINNYDCDTSVICENFRKNGYNKIYIDTSAVCIHKD